MNSVGFNGIPEFLRVLTTSTPPHAVLRPLIRGPLSGLGVRQCRLWVLDSKTLISVAGEGLTREEHERYSVLPASFQSPMWTVLDSREVLVQPLNDELERLRESPGDRFWAAMLDRVGAVSVVRMPLVLGTSSIGGLTLVTGTPWRDEATPVVEAAARALALWLVSERRAIDEYIAEVRGGRKAHLVFTDRQKRALQMVLDGRSNRQIATSLCVSLSTVKADLSRAMHVLEAPRRDLAAQRAVDLGIIDPDKDFPEAG